MKNYGLCSQGRAVHEGFTMLLPLQVPAALFPLTERPRTKNGTVCNHTPLDKLRANGL